MTHTLQLTAVIFPSKSSARIFLDSGLTMEKQVSNVCRTAYLKIRKIGIIRHFRSDKTTAQLVRTHILTNLSRLNYCNSLLAGVTSQQIPHIQNSAAKLVLRRKCKDNVTPFAKTSLATSQTKNQVHTRHFSLPSLQPYSSAISLCQTSRSLRSRSAQLLSAPRVHLKSAGERSFSFQFQL